MEERSPDEQDVVLRHLAEELLWDFFLCNKIIISSCQLKSTTKKYIHLFNNLQQFLSSATGSETYTGRGH